MKNSRKQENQQSKQGKVNTPKPDVRDDLDSRKNKEEGYKSNNNTKGVKPNTKNQNEAGH